MFGQGYILAAQGKDVTDWTQILGPILLMALYGIVWVINKVAEQSHKKRAESEAEIAADQTQSSPRPNKTSPLNRAVPRKREQPTLSQTLGRLAGQIANQANLPAPQPANPPNQPVPVTNRMSLPSRQVPQPRSQSAPPSSASKGPIPFSQPRPKTSQVATASQRQSPIPHSQPRPQPVAAVATQPPKSAPTQPAAKPPAAASPHKVEADPAVAAHPLGFLVGDKNSLREGIILSEILGRPLALRSDSPDSY